jgi:micrococcal nuclease
MKKTNQILSIIFLFIFGVGCAPLVESKKESGTSYSKSQVVEPTPSIPPQFYCIPSKNRREIAYVVKVIDGDTILVKMNNVLYEVRYIGVNAPEFDSPQEAAAQYATDINRNLIQGKTIWMVKDIRERDKYQRLLRFVFVGDVFVNYELVHLGAAEVKDYPPDLSCQKLFKDAVQ